MFAYNRKNTEENILCKLHCNGSTVSEFQHKTNKHNRCMYEIVDSRDPDTR